MNMTEANLENMTAIADQLNEEVEYLLGVIRRRDTEVEALRKQVKQYEILLAMI